MHGMRVVSGIAALSLLLQGCAGSAPMSGSSRATAITAASAAPPPTLRYYGKSETGQCRNGPGGPLSVTAAISLFVLTTGWNIVRGELQRRAKNEADRFTSTFGARTNVTTTSGDVSCIEFTRRDAQGDALTLWYEISPYGPIDGAIDPRPAAVVIRPAGMDYKRAMARTRGANPKMNLAVAISISAVVQGENGPELRTLPSATFAYEQIELGTGVVATGSQPSPVTAPLPRNAAATIAIAVTEKGPGGEFYTDLSGALESSKEAVQTLIEHFFAEE